MKYRALGISALTFLLAGIFFGAGVPVLGGILGFICIVAFLVALTAGGSSGGRSPEEYGPRGSDWQ